MAVADLLLGKLETAFSPDAIELIDESEQHRGHAGWREGGETHFRLRMVSAAFTGLSRVERQRAVNRVLADELSGPVHAFAMELRAPGD